jgi:2-polyprenyl-3-methyl-5-hydroxy-6-metoxy-1,4-benzoquinol methylase
MTGHYDPKAYWESRLQSQFTARGVGHIGFSDEYNRWLYRRKRKCIEAALRNVSLVGKDVLDVGCGTGFFVEWYLARGAQVCGIDITDVSVQRLRKLFDGEFKTINISDSAFDAFGKKFDVVNVWDVFYHIVSDSAFNAALQNIKNSLKDGGLLLFTDFLGEANDIPIADHVKGRCFKTYSATLNASGFHFIGIRPLYRFLNQSHFGKFDNYLGSLYFFLDTFSRKIQTHNLSLSVWRYGVHEEGNISGSS